MQHQYDFKMETKWKKTEIQFDQRSDHHPIILNSSKILLVGGRSKRLIRPEIISTNGSSLDQTSIENLSTILKTNEGQEENRWAFASCYSPELNLIFIGGGCNGETVTGRCHLFKTDEKRFQEVRGVPDLPSDQVMWPSATFSRNHVFIFGGQSDWRVSHGRYSNRVFKLDPRTLKWSEIKVNGIKKVPSPRSQSLAFYCSGKLHVYGGCDGRNVHADLHSLDEETGDWSKISTCGHLPATLGNLRKPPKDREPPDFSPAAAFSTADETMYVLNRDFASENLRVFKLNLRTYQWTVIRVKRDLKIRNCQWPRLAVRESALCLIDGLSGKTSLLKLTNRLSWSQERILWLACFKNDPETCLLAKCPPMIVYKIIGHANTQ